MRRHVVISGTGRAGTSFLMTLLTRLGLDTGYSEGDLQLSELSRAGLERDIRRPGPFIIKSPWLSVFIEDVLARDDIKIEHAILPMRDLNAAALSSVHVSAAGGVREASPPGGLWLTRDPGEQPAILAQNFHHLVFALAAARVPISFLTFPRLTRDAGYVYEILNFLVGHVPYQDFARVHAACVRPEWVHTFSEADV